jgi:hypothetical protein
MVLQYLPPFLLSFVLPCFLSLFSLDLIILIIFLAFYSSSYNSLGFVGYGGTFWQIWDIVCTWEDMMGSVRLCGMLFLRRDGLGFSGIFNIIDSYACFSKVKTNFTFFNQIFSINKEQCFTEKYCLYLWLDSLLQWKSVCIH